MNNGIIVFSLKKQTNKQKTLILQITIFWGGMSMIQFVITCAQKEIFISPHLKDGHIPSRKNDKHGSHRGETTALFRVHLT